MRRWSTSGRGRARRARRLAAIAAALVLVGCGPRIQYWSQPESPKENRVEWAVFAHPVAFTEGDGALAPEEARRLDRFLGSVKTGYGDQVVVRARRGAASPQARTVQQRLRGRSILAEILETPQLDTRAGAVLVEVGRYTVTTPRCPDWTKPAGYDPNNTVGSNFGCATVTNLGAMVADPGDLIRGREHTVSDGTYDAYHIDRYRKGLAPKTAPNPGSLNELVPGK